MRARGIETLVAYVSGPTGPPLRPRRVRRAKIRGPRDEAGGLLLQSAAEDRHASGSDRRSALRSPIQLGLARGRGARNWERRKQSGRDGSAERQVVRRKVERELHGPTLVLLEYDCAAFREIDVAQ